MKKCERWKVIFDAYTLETRRKVTHLLLERFEMRCLNSHVSNGPSPPRYACDRLQPIESDSAYQKKEHK